MNLMILNGRLCTEPKMSIIQLWEQDIVICRFVMGITPGTYEQNAEEGSIQNQFDYFQCITFGVAARKMKNEFYKGCKVAIVGKLKNYQFEDVNKTAHFTNIVLVDQIEFGDTYSAINPTTGRKAFSDIATISNFKEMESNFQSICDKGFLCVDEDDYYKIATMNMA